jgi:hypothetical protein
MFLNEQLFLQVFSLVLALFSLSSLSILSLWYLAGLFLISTFFYLVIYTGDILLGFLLIAEFAAALVFYIFILKFTSFASQKNYWSLSSRLLAICYVSFISALSIYVYLSSPNNVNLLDSSSNVWLYLSTWYDFAELYYSYYLTDLTGIRELYFSESSGSFIILNFLVIFYVVSCLYLSFSQRKYSQLVSSSQLYNKKTSIILKTGLFIKTQNYVKQQEASLGTRLLRKNLEKSKKITK